MILSLFAIFLTFAVYGNITFDLTVQEIKKFVGLRNEGLASGMIKGLDEYLEKRVIDFNNIAKLKIVQDSLKASNAEFQQLTDMELFIKERESKYRFQDADGSVPFLEDILDKNLSITLARTIDFYQEEYGYDVVHELFVTNAYGANVALGSGTTGYMQNDEIWWQKAKSDGVFYGPLVYSEEHGDYSIGLGIRITDKNGDFLGVMRVSLTLKDILNKFTDEAELLSIQNRNVILLDNAGKIIYSEGISDILTTQPVYYYAAIKKGANIGTFSLETDPDELKLISYAKSIGFRTFPGFGWVILIEQGSSDFVDEVIDLRDSILFVSIFGMMASLLIGMLVSFLISNPLRELSKISRKISQGNFEVRAKRSRINEIDTIGHSFNKMTASLKKLIETEKELAEANVRVKNERFTAIGELAARMAHDMKNPLATIQSSADIIKRNVKGITPEIDDVIKRMNDAVSKMSHQIEDVLNYVRITPLNEIPISVNSLLNSALQSIEVPKNITIQVQESPVHIKCDTKKMEIVFINLILNAIQAIAEKDGKIIIRIEEDKESVIIEFEDSGEGIPEELLSKIFDPLVTTKEKGTGLGLSTCKNVIEQHGGSIEAENNPTVFTVTLPKI